MNKSMIIAAVVIALGLFAVAGGIFYAAQKQSPAEARRENRIERKAEGCLKQNYPGDFTEWRWNDSRNKCQYRCVDGDFVYDYWGGRPRGGATGDCRSLIEDAIEDESTADCPQDGIPPYNPFATC